MKTKIKKNLMIVLATLFLFAFFVLSALPLTNANADIASGIFNSERYTNVMDDLQKDEKFNTDDYPAVKDDYSLKVIQIAESSAKELFVYVYQPADETRDLIATSINISTGIGDELNYWNYELRLLSTNGVFDKYLVKDFKVSTDEERTYDISNIYRAWNKGIDEATGNDNTISEVGYKVGQQWTAKTVNCQVLYTYFFVETVKITEKVLGYIYYPDGFFLTFEKMTDSHFVAFDTDFDIGRLFEVDLVFSYYQETWTYGVLGGPYHSITPSKETIYKTISYTDKGSNSPDGIFKNNKYTWNRIESCSSFMESLADDEIKYTKGSKDLLSNQKWVLRYWETTRSQSSSSDGSFTSVSTGVSDLSLLRLKFETNGVVYNLGAVDNKMSNELFMGTAGEHDCILWKLLAILIIVGLVCWLFNQIFPWFFPLLGKIITGSFKFIWYVVSFKWLRDLIYWKKRKQPQQVVIVNSSTSGKRKRKKRTKKPPTK